MIIFKRVALTILVCFLVLVAGFTVIHREAIFQRGDPLPYIGKMLTLNDHNTYSKVFADKDTYITQYTDAAVDTFCSYIENTYHVQFISQMGGDCIFHSDEQTIFADFEVYWGNYLVWDLTFYGADYINPDSAYTPPHLPH